MGSHERPVSALRSDVMPGIYRRRRGPPSGAGWTRPHPNGGGDGATRPGWDALPNRRLTTRPIGAERLATNPTRRRSMEPLIQLRGVTKRYADVGPPALDGIDLAIEPGAITAIMGPSGGGKSTLLNLVGGLDRPPRGEGVVDGVRVDRLGEAAAARFRRAKVGFVFQFFHLLDDLTVRDNVAVAAMLGGRSPGDSRRVSEELLGQLGLGHRARDVP